ncbi:7634_t:CDS:2 [Acaulospora morrowiae]|uniref:7634_t:CDS:1 n=1 Tax=Acaulospora morrowiae TaxID=94023 RepID=A0A9N9A5C8_9GLOM|nr:7634_t:CDS:2 [Acaulospora morrowiae]
MYFFDDEYMQTQSNKMKVNLFYNVSFFMRNNASICSCQTDTNTARLMKKSFPRDYFPRKSVNRRFTSIQYAPGRLLDSPCLPRNFLWNSSQILNGIKDSSYEQNQSQNDVTSRHQQIFLQRIYQNGHSPIIDLDKTRHSKHDLPKNQVQSNSKNSTSYLIPNTIERTFTSEQSNNVSNDNKFEFLPSSPLSSDSPEYAVDPVIYHIYSNRYLVNIENLNNNNSPKEPSRNKEQSSKKLNNRNNIFTKKSDQPINNIHPFNHHHRKNSLCSIGSYMTLLLNKKSRDHDEYNKKEVDSFTNAFGSLLSVQSPPGEKNRRMILVNPPSILGNIKDKKNTSSSSNIFSLYDMVCPTPYLSKNLGPYLSDYEDREDAESEKIFEEDHEYYEEPALPSSALSSLKFSIRSPKVISPTSISQLKQ